MRAIPDRVTVYGAGGFGRSLVEHLQALNVEVVSILDQAAVGQHAGVPIIHPKRADDLWRDLPVVLGVHNPLSSATEILTDLRREGFGELVSTVQAAQWIGEGGASFEHYWLTGRALLDDEAARGQMAAARDLLADEESQLLFDQLLRYRQHGSLEDLPEPLPLSEQYFPPDLAGRIDYCRVVDCGAYDGDTVRALTARQMTPEWVLALEPDPANFAALLQTCEQTAFPVVPLPLGAWSDTELLRFTADGSAGAAVDTGGTVTIQGVALDTILGPAHWAPTYLKMDIEGSELQALQGIAATVARSVPSLAISAYHRPEDLWEIPMWVHRQMPGAYAFYLRQYGFNGFDTVLYAVPKDGS